MIKASILFFSALLFVCFSFSNATVIYVSGYQTGTWSADTVIVTGEVCVPSGQMLNIFPGVEVLFSVYCKLDVDNGATLRAIGTEADSIRFDVLPPNSSWHGLRFYSSSNSCYLKHCHLTHGKAWGDGSDIYGGSIYIYDSSPTIRNCLIDSCIADPGGYWWGTGGAIAAFNSNAIILDNKIIGNTAMHGGGISFDNSTQPVIKGNIITGNISIIGSGGGIRLWDSNAIISDNIISGNSANGAVYGVGGGICIWAGSAPMIQHNLISGNSATAGGGIHAESSSIYYVISENLITGNSASGHGGGINCMPYVGFHYLISNNTIEGNISAFGGGISYTGDAEASVVENTIDGNIATYGGGIYCENTTPDFSGNTICENFANNGSGIYSQGSNPRLVNCILWGNIGQQIVGTSNVTYSDIQDGYPGAGNINIYPAFVDTVHNDYRLQWNSSCIDTGDPNPIYNDPDNTRADMGAWYYDQSIPIRVLLIPYSEPIKIPAGGGSFQYAIQFTNIADTILNVLCWCDVTLPSGPPYGPVLGPLNLSLASGQTLNWVRSQAVHAVVPTGIYRYNAFAVTAGDTSRDNFLFIKLGGTGISRSTDAIQPGTAGWVNTAEEFAYTEFYEGIRQLAGVIQPNVFNLSVYPNPFNSSTIISFELFSVSPINLKIYNIYGQEISKLETRNSQPGTNQIEWNAEGLPSGIYFARLEVGELCLTQKMMLLK